MKNIPAPQIAKTTNNKKYPNKKFTTIKNKYANKFLTHKAHKIRITANIIIPKTFAIGSKNLIPKK